MLVYVMPILLLIGTVLVLGTLFAKDEKQRDKTKLAAKIVGIIMGIFFLIMVIAFIDVFIQLNV